MHFLQSGARQAGHVPHLLRFEDARATDFFVGGFSVGGMCLRFAVGRRAVLLFFSDTFSFGGSSGVVADGSALPSAFFADAFSFRVAEDPAMRQWRSTHFRLRLPSPPNRFLPRHGEHLPQLSRWQLSQGHFVHPPRPRAMLSHGSSLFGRTNT